MWIFVSLFVRSIARFKTVTSRTPDRFMLMWGRRSRRTKIRPTFIWASRGRFYCTIYISAINLCISHTCLDRHPLAHLTTPVLRPSSHQSRGGVKLTPESLKISACRCGVLILHGTSHRFCDTLSSSWLLDKYDFNWIFQRLSLSLSLSRALISPALFFSSFAEGGLLN